MNCSAGLPANFRDAEQTDVALEVNQKYPDFKTMKCYAPFKNKIVLAAPQIACTFLDKEVSAQYFLILQRTRQKVF